MISFKNTHVRGKSAVVLALPLLLVGVIFWGLPTQASAQLANLKAQDFLQVTNLRRGLTLNVRSGPGTQYRAVTVVRAEDVGLLPLEREGRWQQISFCGYEGWVSTTYVEPMQAGDDPRHDCRSTGPNGLNADIAANGSTGITALDVDIADMTLNAAPVAVAPPVLDAYGLPVRATPEGRSLGQLPETDAFLDCMIAAATDATAQRVCADTERAEWFARMERAEALALQVIDNDAKRRQFIIAQGAWQDYQEATCQGFAFEGAPVAVKSHLPTCAIEMMKQRTLEIEQLVVLADQDCQLCEREQKETAEATIEAKTE